jgi:DNA-binding Lrp family transcriptional regulator
VARIHCDVTGSAQLFGVTEIDDLNRHILRALIRNGRSTYAEIGSAVGLSVSATKRRGGRRDVARRRR